MMAPVASQRPPELEQRRAELERMGFKIVYEDSQSVIGTRAKWHWDCFFVKLTTVAWVKRVPEVSAQTMEADKQWLKANAARLDPSALPIGFQKGRCAAIVYLADRAWDDAKARAGATPAMEFGAIFLTAIRESTGEVHAFTGTPLWGAALYPKIKFVVRRLLDPMSPDAKEPLSMVGAIMVVILGLMLVFCFCGLPLLVLLGSLLG
jgi:hypothetical protein